MFIATTFSYLPIFWVDTYLIFLYFCTLVAWFLTVTDWRSVVEEVPESHTKSTDIYPENVSGKSKSHPIEYYLIKKS